MTIVAASLSVRQCDGEHGLDAAGDVDLHGNGAGDHRLGNTEGTGFTTSGATFPVTLNPGQSATLNVQFDPTATGAATGELTIQSNSSTNSTAVVNLSGTGTAVLSPQLMVSAASLTFGDVTVNTASTQPVTLTRRDGPGDHQLGNTGWGRIYGVGGHVPGHADRISR